MYTSDIENRQHLSSLEYLHRQFANVDVEKKISRMDNNVVFVQMTHFYRTKQLS